MAVSLALLGHAVMYAALRRLGTLSIVIANLEEHTRTPARVALPLFALQLVVAAMPTGLPLESLLRHTTSLLLIGSVTWFTVKAVAGIAEGVIRLNPSDIENNLEARRVQTHTRVLARTLMVFLTLLGTALALMLFPGVRQIGTTLLASAGLAGLAVGIAARPVLASLIAGLQIALTQPIRIDDVVIIENEWGRIEEITATYVVVRIWDERRLIVPLQWVIEHPFQNWTRTGSQLLGSVSMWVDYCTPLAPLRQELKRICQASGEWDGRTANLQVVDCNEKAIQLRALVSAADASRTWDLRCRVREQLIEFLQHRHPEALPQLRVAIDNSRTPSASTHTEPMESAMHNTELNDR